jgi:hypothetical protein
MTKSNFNKKLNLPNFNEWRVDNFPQQLDREILNPAAPPAFSEWNEEEWSEVPGIGSTLAQRLVDARPLTFEDMRGVKGITNKVIENVKGVLSITK